MNGKVPNVRQELEGASEALYRAFAPYAGAHLEGCPHCVSFGESAALRRAPLRALGAELDRYLFKAMTTWGTEEDFKHFVPRLVERYAQGTDAWLLCDKLAYAGWRSWAEPERAAVERYFLVLWRAELEAYGPPLPGRGLLETMLTLDLDLAPYDLRTKLEAWRSDPSRDAAQSLASFVLDHGMALFWPSPSVERALLFRARPEVAAEVCAWLLEPTTRTRLEASYFEHGDASLARAFDWLEAAAREQ